MEKNVALAGFAFPAAVVLVAQRSANVAIDSFTQGNGCKASIGLKIRITTVYRGPEWVQSKSRSTLII